MFSASMICQPLFFRAGKASIRAAHPFSGRGAGDDFRRRMRSPNLFS